MSTPGLAYSDENKTYAECRPHYPPELFEKVFKRVLKQGLAVDVGTGTGQALEPLAQNFDRVVAVDCSPQQLAEAVAFSNVTFTVATAERLTEEAQIEDESVDLIISAEALHWFDREQFYRQCLRALKPGGCLAAWGYFFWNYLDNPVADAILMTLYSDTLGRYWPESYQHVMNDYKDLPPGDGLLDHHEKFYIPPG